MNTKLATDDTRYVINEDEKHRNTATLELEEKASMPNSVERLSEPHYKQRNYYLKLEKIVQRWLLPRRR